MGNLGTQGSQGNQEAISTEKKQQPHTVQITLPNESDWEGASNEEDQRSSESILEEMIIIEKLQRDFIFSSIIGRQKKTVHIYNI